MPSQGPNSGGSFVNDATVGAEAWVNETLAGASDNVRASVSLGAGEVSQYLRATDFGFSIPAGATIDGVVVGIERRSNAGRPKDSTVRLYTGSFVGDNEASATLWPITESYEDHGGAGDAWSAGLTAAAVNASTFGVGISANNPDVSSDTPQIDHIRITVYYSETPIFPIYDMLVT